MIRRLVLSTALITCGFVAGLVVTGRMRTAEESLAQPRRALAAKPAAAQHSAPAAAVATGGPDFTRIAGLAIKGVANISSLQIVRTRNSAQYADPFFRYFFGDDEFFGPRHRASKSLGSGVIISADGYVVTNTP